jgi:DNA-binding winged helix-turn-helix (wHTH) protein
VREKLLQLQQLLQTRSGNLYEGIKLTRNQQTMVDMLLAANVICSKASLYAGLYGSTSYKPDLKILREMIRVIRKQIRPHGIEIRCVFGKGYIIDNKSKTKLRELITQ